MARASLALLVLIMTCLIGCGGSGSTASGGAQVPLPVPSPTAQASGSDATIADEGLLPPRGPDTSHRMKVNQHPHVGNQPVQPIEPPEISSTPSPLPSPTSSTTASPTPSPSPTATPQVVFQVGVDKSGLQSAFDEMRKKGLYVSSLTMYGTTSAPQYVVFFSNTASSDQQLLLELDQAAMKKALDAASGNGFSPIALGAVGATAPTARFTAVIAHTGRTTQTELAIPEGSGLDTFIYGVSKWTYPSPNLIPTCAAVYGTSSARLYAVNCTQNVAQTNWTYYWGIEPSYVQADSALLGTVLSRLHFYAVGPGGFGLAVLGDNSLGKQRSFYSITLDGLKNALNTLPAQGFFPIHVNGTGSGSTARFSVIFANRVSPVERQFAVEGPSGPASYRDFDEYIRGVMTYYGIRHASLAVVRNGKLVLAHGYTWAEPDIAHTLPTSLFRIASTSKLLTATSIWQQIQKGNLSLDTTMQSVLQLTPPGGGKPADARWNDVTVGNMLTHSGGWDDDVTNGFDPMFDDANIASALGTNVPINKYQIASYMCGQPLNFDPGCCNQYCNLGFSLLGQMLEKKNGDQPYATYVQNNIFAPLGLKRPQLATSLQNQQVPDEVLFQQLMPSVEANVTGPTPAVVNEQYGGYNMGNFDSMGGWVMASVDYAKFLAAFDQGANNPLLQPATVSRMWTNANLLFCGATDTPCKNRSGAADDMYGWWYYQFPDASGKLLDVAWHNGWFTGNSALVFRRADGLSFVLYTDEGVNPFLYITIQGPHLNAIANKITDWPSGDLFPSFGIPSF